jgi:hypothetical protein
MTTTLTVDVFTQLIRNKRDLYEACKRNGYYLLKFKSPMVTEDYTCHVIIGKSFCTKRVEIRMLPCPRPSNKESLVDMFRVLAEHNEWLLVGFDEKYFLEKGWLPDVIATFAPDAPIFAKDYLPPCDSSKLSEIKSIEVPTDFIRGLPLSQRKNR